MKFISILITFFVVFNINSICYSSSLDNINNSNVLSVKYDFNLDNIVSLKNISLNEDTKTNDLITSNQILSGSYGAYVVAYLISFFIFGIQTIQRNNDLYMFGLILSTYTLPSFISAFFIYNDSKDEYQGDFAFTVLGAFTGTVLYYLLAFLAVFIESKISNEIRSKISDFLFIPLIILLPLFTSTFATIFYNLSKKPKENIFNEEEIIEEQRKIQEKLLSTMNNIQVNNGNIEYKVFAF